MNTISFKSHAKVNIGLQVLGERNDGYHDIHTMFQELEFHDNVHISKKDHGCELFSNDNDFPLNETNTCHTAYTVVKDAGHEIGGISVHVEKSIPQGAGLGGGSSNGAAIIRGLNELYECGLSNTEMENLALKVGADVPFFIQGKTQLGEGIGEKLTPIDIEIDFAYLLVISPVSISTSWAYSALKNGLEGSVEKTNFASLFKGDTIPFELFKNDFERIVIPAHPEIGEIKDALINNGAHYASLSGSGSTVFGMFDEDTAAKAAESVLMSDYRTILTHPV
ncbi:MAG TPA: 4-(cytidine 5'-diphospho)-2-C-methyl-D-erythritol kinase [Candidatus Marinimicrobia bacterium]|nr:4-(cytidine 5'-diphospho)-2-C-methyl-D-erythritol kinase [Candidatus Neomarinimicrobiota bacterium]MDP7330205.1 4-(cytidine 5'-diphospho)-2-C-methyl-D-erythritol kinase [Candidatus Neomarinimicrobiota bacterium]HBN45549.1 4-(cytidine 5'-diphospho)-2-C-methyl-D-erythritol kinase [Candidatus Neomarinimicrobiota bacterium]HJL74434.1 4-(cytidine 5'-diphospho)-2-C-methyl-D-erythritol kinase [Candidatus Neomarinimicrobiota bacterium]HJM69294.1 4-(cytidine 5'-diphospho)-2-C-methyl-D-erythritol kina|tara:strand:+ start:31145 stop:31984 length:840 start_codon:yes stop_codon:yes gene_type:complete